MCSVVGYVGSSSCKKNVLEGLDRLEYRGYDTAGFACFSSEKKSIASQKVVGGVQSLRGALKNFSDDGHVGIGHTRWSSHGGVSERNAHPHFDCRSHISLVHNGIIENHHILRTLYRDKGHTFISDTDTEVVAHILEHELSCDTDLVRAVCATAAQLEGSYVCLCLLHNMPDQLLVMRHRLPVVIGIGAHEMFVASDPVSFAGRTDRAVFLPDNSFACISQETINLYNFDGSPCIPVIEKLSLEWSPAGKNGYEHHMLKEIYEQKDAIKATLDNHSAQELISPVKAVHIIACGTSFHAGLIGKLFIEQKASVPVTVSCASEYRYGLQAINPDTLYIFISQSGETADTLEALRVVKSHGGSILVITNTPTSSMGRLAEHVWVTHAGTENAVAATKTFTAQLAVLYLLAQTIAVKKKNVSAFSWQLLSNQVSDAADSLYNSLERYKQDSFALAYLIKEKEKALFIGRHMGYALALEGALKLQEIAYVHAISCAAGEIKHGPLALVDPTIPIFIFSIDDTMVYQKLVSNVQEIAARKGYLIIFAYEGQDELLSLAAHSFVVPRHEDPLLSIFSMIGVMQQVTYAIANARGCPIDRPRNLAKSVTIE